MSVQQIKFEKIAALAAIITLLTGCQAASTVKKTSTRYVMIEETTRPITSKPKPVEVPQISTTRTAIPEYSRPPIEVERLPSLLPPQPQVPPPIPEQPKVVLRDGSNIPAFARLLAQAQQQLAANQLNLAEQTLIRAQRMAPQSAAVYAHLSHVALKKRQGGNAEAMARKGLMFATTVRQQHAFWQLILAAAEVQNNPILASQARTEMQKLAGQL